MARTKPTKHARPLPTAKPKGIRAAVSDIVCSQTSKYMRDYFKENPRATFEDARDLVRLFVKGALPCTWDHLGPLDEESDERVKAALLALNEAGVVTTCSQPGVRGRQFGQHEFVTFYTGLGRPTYMKRLREWAAAEKYVVNTFAPDARFDPDAETAMDVTFWHGVGCTRIGRGGDGAAPPHAELYVEVADSVLGRTGMLDRLAEHMATWTAE